VQPPTAANRLTLAYISYKHVLSHNLKSNRSHKDNIITAAATYIAHNTRATGGALGGRTGGV